MAKKKLYAVALATYGAGNGLNVAIVWDWGKSKAVLSRLNDAMAEERKRKPGISIDTDMEPLPDELIRKVYAALPDNAISENDQLKAKLAETAKDLIYARNEAKQTRLQLGELEKKFAMSTTVPYESQAIDLLREFILEQDKKLTAHGQELEVLRSQLVQLEKYRDEIILTLLPLYALYLDADLQEIIRRVRIHEGDYEEAFKIARADGYKGDSLEEFAQHVIITRKAAEAEARACEDLMARIDATTVQLSDTTNQLSETLDRLASAEDSLKFFSDLQAFPPYAEYLVSVPEATEPMTFPVWLQEQIYFMNTWKVLAEDNLADKDRWDWLNERTVNGAIDIVIRSNFDGVMRTEGVAYIRFSDVVARMMNDAARNQKGQETEFDEEIPE